jgi:hypothetical protein
MERYIISGVQLGLLLTLDRNERAKVVNEIIDEQFIGTSQKGRFRSDKYQIGYNSTKR